MAQMFKNMLRQVGGMVAKVLRGAKPADLPIELPSKRDLGLGRNEVCPVAHYRLVHSHTVRSGPSSRAIVTLQPKRTTAASFGA
jgi:hypothetical protein